MEIEKLDVNAVCFGILCNFPHFCGEERAKEAAELVRALQSENEKLKAEVPRWIPAEGRKPKPSDNPILIYKARDGRANFIGTAWYSSLHGWIPTNGTKIYGVTHWMPLPPPPTGGR